MVKRFCIQATFATAICGFSSFLFAQNQATQTPEFRPFNGFFAGMFGDDQQPPKQQPPKQQPTRQQANNQQTAQQSKQQQQQPGDSVDAEIPPPMPAVRHPVARSNPAPVVPVAAAPSPSDATGGVPITGKNLAFQFDDGSGSAAPMPQSTVRSAEVPALPALPAAPPVGNASGSTASLHDVLQGSQQSQFSSADAGSIDKGSSSPDSAPTQPPVPPQNSSTTASTAAASDAGSQQPAPTQQTQSSVVGSLQSSVGEAHTDAPAAASTARVGSAAETAKGDNGSQVLSARKSPMLSTETIGPQRIAVGKEATYEVLLQNTGEVAAEEVNVSVVLPDWAEVAGATPSSGRIQSGAHGRHEPCLWYVGRVEAKSRERLSLKIVPRASKPFELVVKFDFKAAPAQVMIEVQEPKLSMKLDGPREVLFGKHEVYKLKLSNQGNGAAENVVLRLMPLSEADTQPVSHKLGTIAAGDERSIEIELTARQPGDLLVRLDATSDAGARAELSEKIVVHRPALKVEADGPVMQYVGTPATYKIHVRNPGDAPVQHVKLAVRLPAGVRFLSGSDGATATQSDEGSKVEWTLEQLAPGAQRELSLKCTLALSGANRLEIAAVGDGGLNASAEAQTRVEALADLRLDVKDPEGPVPVGQEATYELRIRNRGTKAAEGVEVFAFFSSGIEPVAGEGHPHRVGPGQVVFAPLPVLPPATEVTLRVRAKATSGGNHIFRAEVHCRASGTRLVREETTHFYEEGLVGQPANPMPAMPSNTMVPRPMQPAPATAAQTAPGRLDTRSDSRAIDRSAPLPLPQQQPATPLPGAGTADRSPTGNRF